MVGICGLGASTCKDTALALKGGLCVCVCTPIYMHHCACSSQPCGRLRHKRMNKEHGSSASICSEQKSMWS